MEKELEQALCLTADKAITFDDKISNLGTAMQSLEQVSCPVVHRFGPGIYIREVTIPAGSVAVGHHQKLEHNNIFLKGKVTMLNADGSTTNISAPMIFTSKPGRKIGYVHEDVVWLNVYATEEKDIEKLEEQFLEKEPSFIEAQNIKACSLLLETSVNHNDYDLVLKEFGFTHDQVRDIVENTMDLIDLPSGGYKIKVGRSSIDGKGLIATADIHPGEIIAPARISGKRTIAGRYTNHSVYPNAKMFESKNGNIDLVAISKISGCMGGFDGEEITINNRDSLKLNFKIGGLL
jgi:hypothetical protein